MSAASHQSASGDGAQRRRLAWGVYVVATLLAFPHELPWGGSIDLGLVFAWIVPAAFVVAIEGLSPRVAARSAFLASLLAHTLFFHWFMIVTLVYGGMPFWIGVFAPLVPAIWVSLFSALFAWGWTHIARLGPAPVVQGAALWIAVDWLRGHLLGGFPWASLGYALHADTPLLHWTRWTGYYGLGFVAAAVGIAAGRVWLARGGADAASTAPLARRSLSITLAGVAALHAVGWVLVRAEASSPVETSTLRVAAIQGNIDQSEKWEAERRSRILEGYLRLSQQAADETVDWIVWPETAVPGLLEFDTNLRTRLGALARRNQVALVVGGMGADVDREAGRYSAFYDSAFVIDRLGGLRDRYDKTHLVPFGEFVPLRGLLGRFFQSLATGLSASDVTPGARPRPVELAPAPGAAPIRVGVPICYELLFPHLVRHFSRQGGQVLLAITNDAWYGRTGAPHQFLAMTALRAAENARPIVRAANTGISAVIDRHGRVLERSPLFEEAVLVADLRLPRLDAGSGAGVSGEGGKGDGRDGREGRGGGWSPTFYARHGDVFAGACIVATLAAGVVALRGGRRRAEEAQPH